jgi:hypothetical protein
MAVCDFRSIKNTRLGLDKSAHIYRVEHCLKMKNSIMKLGSFECGAPGAIRTPYPLVPGTKNGFTSFINQPLTTPA